MTAPDDTTAAALESWLDIPRDSDFPIQNLPLGVFARSAGDPGRIAMAIGDRILDVRVLAESGLLDGVGARDALVKPRLNELFAAGPETLRALRRRVSSLLRREGDPALRLANAAYFFVRDSDARMRLPVDVGDYVDFYSSLEHATNLGRLFRPDGEPLMPNWRWMPIGYHGRSATVVVDTTPIVRPRGQRRAAGESTPAFGPTAMLDIELEVGFIAGRPNALGTPIPVADALAHVAGFVLVNDWSARDIQAWEYQPLGPFLGKSFATTISPWVVTLDALEPFRVAGPRQEPAPLDYLRVTAPGSYDIRLSVELQTARMRAHGLPPQVISRTNFGGMYWSVAQQLAHATVNGARIRAGDLFASGTISGSSPESYGSLIELTWRGERPIALPDDEQRSFLADGDEVTLRGWCEKRSARRIGFGAARGQIVSS
ncbi:MAG: fumarylacetoacetase [Candidatus Eremiobacteraeota bacterium]|nr:fumarylacetoacetase [Candidatus Eremiobacteraeota bacterium]